METINKQYIVDEHNRKIAVQIPIQAFERIEEILENYALVQLMKENEISSGTRSRIEDFVFEKLPGLDRYGFWIARADYGSECH